MQTHFKLGLLSSLLMLSTAPAFASTASGSFQVTASVSDSCSVSAGDLGFGAVDPLSSTATTATSAIDVTCSNSTAYDVGLGPGSTTGASTTSRQMSDGGTGVLNYALYSDSDMTTNWGDTVSTDTVSGTGNGSAQTLTVYGKIPASQSSVVTGSYTDTVNVTVTY